MDAVVPYLPWLLLAAFWIFILWEQRKRRREGVLRPINPPALGEPRGWTNGMLADRRILFVAGQTARDGEGRIIGGGVAPQWDQALANALAVVDAAGGKPTDIARMTVFVTDLAAYRAARRDIGAVWKQRMGAHYPAMSVVEVSGLVDDGAVVEIEATAVLG